MLNELGYATTLYTERANLLAGLSVAEIARHKLFVARMVGRTAMGGLKGIFGRGERKKMGTATAMTAVNSVHYVSDESIGLASLPAIKEAFNTMMPEAHAAVAAITAETTAVTGLAVALGYANMRARQRTGVRDREVSLAESSAAVATLGVPFAAQLGYLRNKKELVKQSVINFGGQHVLFATGALGAAEVVSPAVVYGGAAALVVKQAVEAAYNHQADVLGVSPVPDAHVESEANDEASTPAEVGLQ